MALMIGAMRALLSILAAVPLAAAAQVIKSDEHEFRVVTLAERLDHPWSLAFLPDGGWLVTERPGRLLLITGSSRKEVAGVPRVYASGQGGLLEVALHPKFADNRLVYLSYAEPGEDGAGTALARARLEGERLQELRVIFRQEPKTRGGSHFG